MPIVVQVPPKIAENIVAVPFLFSTPSPLVLAALVPGQILDRACVLVQTAFDGAAPQISLGTFADPDAALPAFGVDPRAVGQYENDQLLPITTPDFLILTIAPSGSTQGTGLLFYRLKR